MALPELEQDGDIRVHVPLSTDAQRTAERTMVEEYLAGISAILSAFGLHASLYHAFKPLPRPRTSDSARTSNVIGASPSKSVSM